MALFVRSPFERAEGPQRDFVNVIRERYTTGAYTSSSDLGERVTERLRIMAADELAPWVILGDTAFRAVSINVRAHTTIIRAVVRSNRVAEFIRSYLDGCDDVPYAGPHDSGVVRVVSVDSEATSTNSRTLEITLETTRNPPGAPAWSGMTSNGVGPEDVQERTLRGALFGEPVDTAFGTEAVNDPLAVLRTRPLPDPVVRSLAYVVIGESLRAMRIPGGASRFVLGPSKPAGRLLELSWFAKAR